jgi:hypothetical protein
LWSAILGCVVLVLFVVVECCFGGFFWERFFWRRGEGGGAAVCACAPPQRYNTNTLPSLSLPTIINSNDNPIIAKKPNTNTHQAQQAVEQREVDLVVQLLKHALHHHDTLAVGRLPHVGQVVDAVAPLVDQQRRRLAVGRLDPVGEEVALVGLEPFFLFFFCLVGCVCCCGCVVCLEGLVKTLEKERGTAHS